MAKSQETFNKKEKEKKRLKKRQDKLSKKEERKTTGKQSFEDMLAYVDENGRISATPPENNIKTVIDSENIMTSVPRNREQEEVTNIKTGIVEFYDSKKGFGFIKDLSNNYKYFVHAKNLMTPIDVNNKVTFEIQKGLRGMNAVNVKRSQ